MPIFMLIIAKAKDLVAYEIFMVGTGRFHIESRYGCNIRYLYAMRLHLAVDYSGAPAAPGAKMCSSGRSPGR